MTEGKIVYVQGTWDLFHIGHLIRIYSASRTDDELIIGVNTDASVRAYKGHLPIIPYTDRVRIVRALGCVDMVIKSAIIINAGTLKEHNVDVCVLGTEWKNKELEGVKEAIQVGIEVVYLPYTKRVSTTIIKNRIRKL